MLLIAIALIIDDAYSYIYIGSRFFAKTTIQIAIKSHNERLRDVQRPIKIKKKHIALYHILYLHG